MLLLVKRPLGFGLANAVKLVQATELLRLESEISLQLLVVHQAILSVDLIALLGQSHVHPILEVVVVDDFIDLPLLQLFKRSGIQASLLSFYFSLVGALKAVV